VKLAVSGQLPEAGDVLESHGYTRSAGYVVETIAAVAKFFGCTDRAVQTWIKLPGWPCAKAGKGGRTHYDLRAVASWLFARWTSDSGAAGGAHGDSDALEEWRQYRAQREKIALLKDRDEVVYRRDAEFVADALVSIYVAQTSAISQELARRFPDAADDIHRRFEDLMRRIRDELTIAMCKDDGRSTSIEPDDDPGPDPELGIPMSRGYRKAEAAKKKTTKKPATRAKGSKHAR